MSTNKPKLSSIFKMSKSIGNKNSDEFRTNTFVLSKSMEELGELSVEVMIDSGLHYKNAGSDGVEGEAVDLAICAMDMFSLQHPDKTTEEIEELFLTKMEQKIEKWRSKLTSGNKK